MASVNKVILVGNLGKDPEVKSFDNGGKNASFSLATTYSYKGRDGNRVDKTEWHNIVIKTPSLVDVAEKFLSKGKQVYIEGRIESRQYDDKDGIKRTFYEIIADSLTMLGRKEDGDNSGGDRVYAAASEPQQSTSEATQNIDDDLPF